jgi:hypothetical protein
MYAAPSASRFQGRAVHSTSNCLVITLGGRIALLALTPKNPATMSPADPVVTEGATIDPFPGVKAPLWESTGLVASMPLKSITDPAADTCDPRDQL